MTKDELLADASEIVAFLRGRLPIGGAEVRVHITRLDENAARCDFDSLYDFADIYIDDGHVTDRETLHHVVAHEMSHLILHEFWAFEDQLLPELLDDRLLAIAKSGLRAAQERTATRLGKVLEKAYPLDQIFPPDSDILMDLPDPADLWFGAEEEAT